MYSIIIVCPLSVKRHAIDWQQHYKIVICWVLLGNFKEHQPVEARLVRGLRGIFECLSGNGFQLVPPHKQEPPGLAHHFGILANRVLRTEKVGSGIYTNLVQQAQGSTISNGTWTTTTTDTMLPLAIGQSQRSATLPTVTRYFEVHIRPSRSVVCIPKHPVTIVTHWDFESK